MMRSLGSDRLAWPELGDDRERTALVHARRRRREPRARGGVALKK